MAHENGGWLAQRLFVPVGGNRQLVLGRLAKLRVDKNPPIKLLEMKVVDGAIHQRERVNYSCPVLPEEVEEARHYLDKIGGEAVLIQVPSSFACAQRVRELAAATGVTAFTVDQTQFTSVDGGGHLDDISARKYTAMLLGWLNQTPEFRKAFPQWSYRSRR